VGCSPEWTKQIEIPLCVSRRPDQISDAGARQLLEMLTSIGQSLVEMRKSVAAMRASTFEGDANSSHVSSDLAVQNNLLSGLLGDLKELGDEIKECRELVRDVNRKLSSLVSLLSLGNIGS
jgi:hypothetical protein